MKFEGREGARIENDAIRVTVLAGGCHIAEILHKESGINPLWIPPWPSIEPYEYDPARNPGYGADSESGLLAGIMGHNLCLDMFGAPSPEEAAAGFFSHGAASVAKYDLAAAGSEIHAAATLALAGLRVERTVRLGTGKAEVHISESVENLWAIDRPIAWTQHVTLGPPFLEPGVTRVEIGAERSRTLEPPAWGDGSLKAGADFSWPKAPSSAGGTIDLATYGQPPASRFTTHLMDRSREEASFAAYNPKQKLLFGYRWKRADFPWLGMWVENEFRDSPPWNRRTRSWGMEFGASPFPETRRQMIERGQLFGERVYRWLPAQARLTVEYAAFFQRKD